MTPVYAAKLGLRPRPININAQKINDSALMSPNMTSASFLFQDSQGKVWFFEKTFLLANTSIEVVLGMLFLALSNADVEFIKLAKLIWRFYTAAKALPTTSRIKLIDKREFTKVALDENSETFVIYVAALEAEPLIHLSETAQIATL